MKFSSNTFTISKKYAEEIEQKKDVFVAVTKTKKTIFLTMVSTYGTSKNPYYNKLIQNEVTMDDLFS
jgi:hypothetical protein